MIANSQTERRNMLIEIHICFKVQIFILWRVQNEIEFWLPFILDKLK